MQVKKSYFFKISCFNDGIMSLKQFLLLDFEIEGALMNFRHPALFAESASTLAFEPHYPHFFAATVTFRLILLLDQIP
jgi:hypothetical protein